MKVTIYADPDNLGLAVRCVRTLLNSGMSAKWMGYGLDPATETPWEFEAHRTKAGNVTVWQTKPERAK